MISDLIVAARGLRRSPTFTVASIVTLALGIGANTTMFSVVNSVLLRPLPGYQTDRLIQICDAGRASCVFLPPGVYLRLRKRAQSFLTVAANQSCRMNLTGAGEPEQLIAPCATANWFEMQHAQAMLGRTFLPDEDQHGRNHVVVLDHGYWQRRFGADPQIVGEALLLDQEPWIVVGIMPPDFRPPGDGPSPIYTPYVVADNPHGLNVTARLKPGVSLEVAQAELNVIARQLSKENPDWATLKLIGRPVLEQVTGPQKPLLLLLLGAVSFVLLIACVNVANLLLARSTARQHEIDIGRAGGQSRTHYPVRVGGGAGDFLRREYRRVGDRLRRLAPAQTAHQHVAARLRSACRRPRAGLYSGSWRGRGIVLRIPSRPSIRTAAFAGHCETTTGSRGRRSRSCIYLAEGRGTFDPHIYRDTVHRSRLRSAKRPDEFPGSSSVDARRTRGRRGALRADSGARLWSARRSRGCHGLQLADVWRIHVLGCSSGGSARTPE